MNISSEETVVILLPYECWQDKIKRWRQIYLCEYLFIPVRLLARSKYFFQNSDHTLAYDNKKLWETTIPNPSNALFNGIKISDATYSILLPD
jgi:hypothetical protein